jgi:hypothetical protein
MPRNNGTITRRRRSTVPGSTRRDDGVVDADSARGGRRLGAGATATHDDKTALNIATTIS